MKKLLCKIGMHDKQPCEAPFVLEGIIGRVETWICKRCSFRNPKGIFVRDGDKVTPEKKLWAEVEDMKKWS